jgi:hypothetical protein
MISVLVVRARCTKTAAENPNSSDRAALISSAAPPSDFSSVYGYIALRPSTKPTINSTRKIKKSILAISLAVPAIPPNPNTPAIIAITKKTSAQYSMNSSLIVSVSN